CSSLGGMRCRPPRAQRWSCSASSRTTPSTARSASSTRKHDPMKLNEIFRKDVTRPIAGVVYANDVRHLGIEVEEYVFTNDAAKGVAPLLEEYTNYTNANGVWISGFFGSGKSHLLKMLAHLLGDVEGQAFARDKVAESFLAKTDDAMLIASLKQAASIPEIV